MSLDVFAVVLLAALLHASWNAIVKGASDKLLTTVLVAAGSAVIAIAALPFLPQPTLESLPYLGVSAILQLGAYLLLARAYRGADMSQIYPLMRGTAPILVALAGTFALGDHLPPVAWIGVVLICAGVLSLALGARETGMAGVRLALPSALVIAAYTLIDGVGVRLSQAAIAYNLWLCLLTGAPLLAWALARRRAEFLAYARANAFYGAVGGFGTLAAYGLALWAMTKAPVAAVAALRETSILFAAAIAAVFLRERMTPVRILACVIIAAGAAVLRLA